VRATEKTTVEPTRQSALRCLECPALADVIVKQHFARTSYELRAHCLLHASLFAARRIYRFAFGALRVGLRKVRAR
jgi:hypothetical protein